MAFMVHKATGDGTKAIDVNAVNNFEAGGIELEKHGRDGLHVIELRQACLQ